MRKLILNLALWCWVMSSAIVPGLAQSHYSDSDLDTLVGPIALYPDPLLTNVVKAATFPDQVVAASKASSKDDSWDDSVKGLKDYPDVLNLMAGNIAWTKSLGWAASNQLADTMDAVQRFRYRAQVAGNLSSDGKVQVVQEGTTIRIEPADPQIIYVPTYNPVYVDDDDDFAEAFVYGAAIATSAYLWTNVYHWNDNHFYAHPYGWRPPAAYYRPYGWQGAGVYGGNAVRLQGNNVVRGPVTVNNVNVNRNRTNVNNTVNRNNVSNVNRNTSVNRANVNSGNSYYKGNVNANNRVKAETRPTVSRPQTGNVNRSSSWGSYSSSGSTMRASNRGAYSRGTTSMGSGARMGRGGGRRR